MKKITTALMGVALLSAVIYAGCKKEGTTSSNPADSDATAAQDEANASFMINDSKTIADGGAKGQFNNNKALGLCGNVSRRDTVIGGNTDTLVDIYFSGMCPDADGHVRNGHILVYWNGKGYFDPTATITQTWKNYSVTTISTGNSIAVTGANTISNTGKDTAGDHSWNCSSSVTLTYSTGGSATWNATRVNTLMQIGKIWYYEVTGSATGTSKSGVTYTQAITSPLYWTPYLVNTADGNPVCGCIEAGTTQFTRTGKTYPLILNYTSGVGNCAYTATATINGKNYNILVP
jgi:hypothetical protein